MTPLPPTPGQTIGPFFGCSLPYPGGANIAAPGTEGAVRFHGTVRDGAGDPVPDALIELWQAGPDGVTPATPGSLARNDWEFTGWGRAATDDAGAYSFRTFLPGPAAEPGTFWSLTVFARGLLDRLHTRAYPEGHGPQPDLAGVEPELSCRLVARRDPTGFRFDIALQGPDQTPFLRFGERGLR